MRFNSVLGLLALSSFAIPACSSDPTTSDVGTDAGTTDAAKDSGKSSDAGPTDSGVTATYSIGGTVAGLTGKGLILTDGKVDLPVSAQGVFTITAKVPTGTAYAVKVKSQPSDPTQTCTVTNGSGTVATSDVTSIAVNCMTDTFTLGGTATGIAGTAVLQNNGADDLNVAANGAFTFATVVKSGAAYAVTVKTQPPTPAQTCVVTAGSGTVAGAPITSVKLDCTTNKYTVKAAVSGLAGTVVLQNNAGDDLTINADSTVPFVTQVASGGAFAVTVKTQPAGQLCVITAGSGNVTNADVTATVTCKAVYTIGGTVVDLLGPLTGTGLVLQNNAANDLPIAANGAFTFATPVVNGGAYAVSVFKQPTAPTRVCTVANGAGNVVANVNNVFVTCGWGAIPAFPNGGADVDPVTGQSNGYGQMAWDENGDILLPPWSGTTSLRRLVRATGVVTDIGGAFPSQMIGIAYDAPNKIAYLGRSGDDNLYKYNLAQPAVAASVVTAVTPSGQIHTAAMVPAGFGGFGGWIATATNGNNIVFVNPANGTKTAYAVGAIANGIVFSATNIMYVLLSSGAVVKMAPNGTTTAFATIGTSCDGLALDEGRGLLYVASSGAQKVKEVKLSDGTITDHPATIPFDGGYWPSPILFDGGSKLVVGVTSGGLRLRQVTVP